jgi:Condensation domain
MKGLSERISALSPAQRALLEARLKEKGLEAAEAAVASRTESIPKRKQHDLCPLSFDQERLWLMDQMEPGNPAYNIYTASRLVGPLDLEIMRRAVNEIVRRHEILRTRFAVKDGSPVMVIAPALNLELTVDDLRALPSTERGREAVRRVNDLVGRPFDLARGPLLRVGVMKIAEQEHVIHVTMHHTITDRWSAAIVEHELAVIYAAFSKGQPSPLPEPSIQFPDFAAWQREWLQGEILEDQLSYWKKQLSGAPMVLDLPTDRPRPSRLTFRGARERLLISRSLFDQLKALSQREGATMFMTLLAAYYLLLYIWTRQQDILVGLTVSNRERPETVGTVGYLLNMVVVRARASEGKTFKNLLGAAREAALGAFAHEDLPLSRLIQELKPEPDASRHPIFQVSYIYLDFPEAGEMNHAGIKAIPLELDNGSSRFDFTLAMTETSDGLITFFEYNTDLFEASTIRVSNRQTDTATGQEIGA